MVRETPSRVSLASRTRFKARGPPDAGTPERHRCGLLDSPPRPPKYTGQCPRFIEPRLPSPADRDQARRYRLMARRDPVGIRLITRRGNDWTTRFPLVVEAVNHLKVRSVLIDGEVVCCNERAIPGARVADHSPRRQSLRQSRKGAPPGKDSYRGRLLPATPRGERFRAANLPEGNRS
jgi:hypothetical protein